LYFQLPYLPPSLAKSTAWIFPLHLQLPYLPTGLKHRSQITEGLVLRPFSYTRGLLTHCTVSTSQFLCVGDGSQRAICSFVPIHLAVRPLWKILRLSRLGSFHLVPFCPLFFFVGCFVLLALLTKGSLLCLDSL
jgi:hypothetical protein